MRQDPPTVVADNAEDELLKRLVQHPLIQRIPSLSDDQFLEMLLQRRFISHIFSSVYDMGIDALSDGDSIKLARQILREEYPGESGDEPSHREDLVADLIALGATKPRIMSSLPTTITRETLTATLELMAEAGTDGNDLRVLTMLRFWGEVVVSVEYGEYWNRLRTHFDRPGTPAPDRPSRFYYEHHSHDGRDALTTASAASKTHSGRLGARLRSLLAVPGALDAFVDVEQRVIDTRLRFYDQFLDVAQLDATGHGASTAAA